MTEYELVDVISSYATQGATFMTLWVTFVSAYAFVAYSVGKNLHPSQVLWLNSLYLFASSATIFGFTGSWKSVVHYIEQLNELNPNSPHIMGMSVVVGSLLIALIGTLMTIKFLWDVRHPKDRLPP